MDHLHRPDAAPGKTASDRSFGWVFTIVFGVIGAWPLLDGQMPRFWAFLPAALFAAATLIRPAWLAPLNRQWTRLGLLLHRIVNPVVLGLIYVVAIMPIGMIFKVMGKDPLRLRRQTRATSYWLERRPPGPPADSLPRQF